MRPLPSRPRCSSSTTPPTTARPALARGARRRSTAADRAASSAAARPRTTATLLQRARGPLRLLLNEDSELLPGRDRGADRRARRATPRRGRGGRAAARPDGAAPSPAPGASRRRRPRSPRPLFLHRCLTVQSRGDRDARGRLGAVGRAARAPRGRRARSAGSTPHFFVYSDEVDFCKRLARRRLAHALRPRGAQAIHHEQLSTDRGPDARGSSSSPATATATCASTTRALPRRARALADGVDLRACAPGRRDVLPGHDPAALLAATSRATLHPDRGEGLREAALRLQPRRARGSDSGRGGRQVAAGAALGHAAAHRADRFRRPARSTGPGTRRRAAAEARGGRARSARGSRPSRGSAAAAPRRWPGRRARATSAAGAAHSNGTAKTRRVSRCTTISITT